MNPELLCVNAIPAGYAFALMLGSAVIGAIFGVAAYRLGLVWKARHA